LKIIASSKVTIRIIRHKHVIMPSLFLHFVHLLTFVSTPN
jgi:hypothetical protein